VFVNFIFLLFITNCLYYTLQCTINMSNKHCKSDDGYHAFYRRYWLYSSASSLSFSLSLSLSLSRSLSLSLSLCVCLVSSNCTMFFLFYFLLTLCFTNIDLLIGLWLFLQLPLISILFYLCQTIHTRNNKTKIHARNNETKKHASFKLSFRNID
jgi:hypothetical protein